MPLLGTTRLLIFMIFPTYMNIWDESVKKPQGFQLEHEYFKVKAYKPSAIQQIVQEKKGLYSKKDKNSMKIRISFLHALDTFLPTCLFGTTHLLIFARFSLVHVYLAQHIYSEHKSSKILKANL